MVLSYFFVKILIYQPHHQHNHALRVTDITTREITTLAGTGSDGFVDGSGSVSQFSYPNGVDCDPSYNTLLYVADRVRTPSRTSRILILSPYNVDTEHVFEILVEWYNRKYPSFANTLPISRLHPLSPQPLSAYVPLTLCNVQSST